MINKHYIIFLLFLLFTIGINSTLACNCGGCGQSHNHNTDQQASDTLVVEPTQTQNVEEKVQCPVMKNWILPTEAADSVEYDGKTYHFCCGGCKEKFLAEPEKYVLESPSDS